MSAEDFDQAKGWIQQCMSTHSSCQKRAQLSTIWSSDNMHIVKDLGYKDMMPRRLLAFPTELSDESSVKLVEITVTQKDQLQLYVALSHRWGGSEIFRTTTSNLDHAKEGMRLADIPRLYREAIQATARLGYEYLWIDALCIVQDDAEDWKQEAKRMAVIYGNSVVSITAMDTKDSGDEIFPTTVADADAESEDLNSRGWVLQEQMISPRSLICTRNGLSWECREADAHHGESELRSRERLQEKKDDKPSNMAIPNHQKELFAFFRDFRVPGVEFDEDQHEFMTVNSDLRGERESYEPLLRAWWKLVAAYSPRKLTFGKDKFLALNGIAGVVLRFTQLKNSFGLWYHFIEHELLWYVDPLGPRATKPREFRVPTWSWANVDGGVVRNSYYERLPAVPQLMVKPEFTMPVGTSFDQELPIPAWTRKYYSITMSGDLRAAEITARLRSDGTRKYDVNLDPVGRSSDKESHAFFSDSDVQFPVDRPVKVLCLHMLQYEKDGKQFPHYIDVRLVLTQLRPSQDLKLHEEYVAVENLAEERTMRRVGYMETTFDEMRDAQAIWEDRWWRHLQLY